MTHSAACPCCGAPLSAKALEFDDEFHSIAFGGRSAMIGPQRYQALALLHHALPRPAYADWLAESLGAPRWRLRKVIYRLRRDIAPLGLEIKSWPGHDRYLLDVVAQRPLIARPQRAKERARLVCA